MNPLAQYSPNANWKDTPDILQTPNQRMDMMREVLHYGLPILVILLGIAMVMRASDAGVNPRDIKWLRWGGAFTLCGGGLYMYFIWWA